MYTYNIHIIYIYDYICILFIFRHAHTALVLTKVSGTVVPSQLGRPQPDNKAMSQKRLEGGMAVN